MLPAMKPRERGDHDHGRGGDDPAGPLEAERDRAGVVVGLVPGLAHAADDEDLVVHREAEEHGEQEDRDPALDLREAVEAEHVAVRPRSGTRHEHAVAGRDREQVEQHRLQRQEQRAERPHQQQVGEREHRQHEPRKRPRRRGRGSRRPAAGRRPPDRARPAGKRGGRDQPSAQPVDEATAPASEPYSWRVATITCA